MQWRTIRLNRSSLCSQILSAELFVHNWTIAVYQLFYWTLLKLASRQPLGLAESRRKMLTSLRVLVYRFARVAIRCDGTFWLSVTTYYLIVENLCNCVFGLHLEIFTFTRFVGATQSWPLNAVWLKEMRLNAPIIFLEKLESPISMPT